MKEEGKREREEEWKEEKQTKQNKKKYATNVFMAIIPSKFSSPNYVYKLEDDNAYLSYSQTVPCSQISVDYLITCKVSHAKRYLVAHLQQQLPCTDDLSVKFS